MCVCVCCGGAVGEYYVSAVRAFWRMLHGWEGWEKGVVCMCVWGGGWGGGGGMRSDLGASRPCVSHISGARQSMTHASHIDASATCVAYR